MRKRCTRKSRPALPPPGMRPKLAPDQVRALAMAHWQNLDAIANGGAGEEILWHWVGGSLTWSRVAELVKHEAAGYAMNAQLQACVSVIDRYEATGRVGFSGPDYTRAREACEWMDALAEHVEAQTALEAAAWSERRIQAMKRGELAEAA